MAECLTLAALAHLLLVLLVGSAPGGSAREGQGVWGAINVTLRGPNRGSGQEATVASDAYTGPAGTAAQRRWGGVVRPDRAPPVPDQVGAARLGNWQSRPADAAPPTPAPAAPTPDAAAATPPPVAPAEPAPPPVRTMPSSVDLPPRIAADVPQPVPLPVVTEPVLPSSPPLQRLPLPPLPPAPPVPPVPPAPVAAPAPVPPPPRVPVPPAPVPAPPAPVPAPPAPVPAPPAPVPAPPAPVPAPPAPVPAPPAPVPAPPAPVAAPKIGLDGLLASPARAGPSLTNDSGAGTRPAAGAPDAGAQVGRDLATPPSLPASAPRLNLELVRPRGGELSRVPAPGVLRVLPRLPEPPKSKLAEGMEKAQKPDCRTAYSGMGVAAVAPLVRDAVTGDGCRW